MLQLSKEKQFTWEKAAKAQKVEKIQKKGKAIDKGFHGDIHESRGAFRTQLDIYDGSFYKNI